MLCGFAQHANIDMSLILFLVVFVVLWLLIEILSIVMKMTGLELSKSRFQIISILTHTGFTTRESELIVQHPVRRRIASTLMIVSYVTQATLITLLFDMLSSDQKNLMSIFIALSAVLLFIIFVTKNKYISDRFGRFAEKILLKRIKKTDVNHIAKILNLSPDFSIYELVVDTDSPICNKTLREIHFKDHYIQILKIDRGAEVLDFPLANTLILPGDRMIVYGKTDSITKMIME